MTSFLSVLFIGSSFSSWIKTLGGAVHSEHWLLSNGQRSHVWFTFSTTFSNVIPKSWKGNEPRTDEEKNSSEIWPSRPVMLMETKSSYSTPNPSANIIIFSTFGYFFPFSISLIYEADNPVNAASCLRPNPFYCLKQRSFIPKKT